MDVVIPEGHWLGVPGALVYTSYWEPQLRKNIAAEPDPAVRFAKWLDRAERGEVGQSVRLIFVEQPYLGWAEAVERIVEATEQRTRQTIAYQILHPNDD